MGQILNWAFSVTFSLWNPYSSYFLLLQSALDEMNVSLGHQFLSILNKSLIKFKRQFEKKMTKKNQQQTWLSNKLNYNVQLISIPTALACSRCMCFSWNHVVTYCVESWRLALEWQPKKTTHVDWHLLLLITRQCNHRTYLFILHSCLFHLSCIFNSDLV